MDGAIHGRSVALPLLLGFVSRDKIENKSHGNFNATRIYGIQKFMGFVSFLARVQKDTRDWKNSQRHLETCVHRICRLLRADADEEDDMTQKIYRHRDYIYKMLRRARARVQERNAQTRRGGERRGEETLFFHRNSFRQDGVTDGGGGTISIEL